MNGYTCRYCYLFIIYWVDFVIGLEANEQMSRTKEPQIFRWNSKQCHDNPFIVARYNSFQYYFFVFISILPSLSEFFFLLLPPISSDWNTDKMRKQKIESLLFSQIFLWSVYTNFCMKFCTFLSSEVFSINNGRSTFGSNRF